MRTATLVAPVRTDRPDAVRPPTDRADGVRTRAPLSDGGRPVDNRPAGTRPRGASPVTPRVGGTHCGSPVGVRGRGPVGPDAAVFRRRRRTAVALLAGVGLAFVVWVFGVVGQNYSDSLTPSAVSAEVVHVRSGDSLSSIAGRVAPEMPREVVIDEIVAMNDLGSSALQVGQPLLTPRYR
ncbi:MULTISPECIES: LysM peptidoglycan-binding domain-containing protein [Gordonia]|uniref:LysM peptidoglycan-binding domain-containing protein n=1 Tax=Gordonia TaxID=2053 RepID=UPI001CFB3A25|nr:LysM peptidoglycan-binding domain-containing protein [Gordonia sp. WA4-43]MCZ4534307.1 LysM peptidoglycan-binding domain-containing protein [Gordonia terrae]UCZ90400.1 LysM peptidoglycan-binding domain-containing protein [Gordonia sp. WA4-43]